MYLSEFLVLMMYAIIVTLLLMLLGEKLITTLSPIEVPALHKIVGSLIFSIVSVAIVVYISPITVDFNFYLLAGGIILFNKYWLGHFTVEKECADNLKKKVEV